MRTSKFKSLLLFAVFGGLLLSAGGAWYWPFDFDPDSTNKPPRLHRLLEKANECIELAEDEALDGNADKAVGYYRDALKELDRIESENPGRAESPEFAPLRSKRATCAAAIDSIRFAQVNENERAVSVSDTTSLERKWRKKHGLQTPEDETFERRESTGTNVVGKTVQPVETNGVEMVEKNEDQEKDENAGKPVNPVSAATGLVRLEQDDRFRNKQPVPASDGSVQAEIKVALVHMRNEDYDIADAQMGRLLKKHPTNLNVLLVRAAAQTGAGDKSAARRTLERAMRAHPKSYLPYYNLASLALQLGEDVSSAREYYELGRTVGGPRNEALENALK